MNNTNKGKVYAERKIQESVKPCWSKLMGFLGSIFVGGASPVVGYLIIQLMWGVTEAQFKGESGLDAIWHLIVIMFAIAVFMFFSKAM